MKKILLALALGAALPALAQEPAQAQAQAQTQAPSAAAFTIAPELREPQLSPDGKQLAALVRQNGKQAVVLRDLAVQPPQYRPVFTTQDAELSLRSLRWLDGERLLLGVRDGRPMRRSDLSQDALMVIWPAKGESINLYSGAGAAVRWNNQRAGLVDSAHTDANFVLLMGADPRLKGHEWGVYRIDTRNAQRTRVAAGVYGAMRYWADAQGQVRMLLRRDGERMQLLHRSDSANAWQPLREWPAHQQTPWFALGFGEQAHEFYVRRADQVLRLDLRQAPDQAGEPVAQNPALLNVQSLLRAPDGARVLGASAPGLSYYWDAGAAAQAKGLAERLQGQTVELQQWLGSHYLAASSREDSPTRYWLGQPEAKRFELLAEGRPGLRDLPQIERERLNPAGAGPLLLRRLKGSAPAPLIWCMDCTLEDSDSGDTAFNPLMAFLVSRGFAVATPQAANSGSAWARGLLPWADGQIPRVLAALKALRQHPWVLDQAPVLIGRELGAYLALRLAPALTDQGGVKAVVAIGVMTDLTAQLARLDDARFTDATRDRFRKLLGNSDAADLRAGSPIHHTAQMPARLLIVHGERNGNVEPNQAKALAEALRTAGRQPQLLLLPGANHDISDGPERRHVLEAIENLIKP
ncbi:dienelactone hydrolase [Inhella inkyongensis]|uniref:Dienelactone hydrolase n=1 Tax=Inhella inkyongensis TaxID=392593 RepID=A0A840SAG2_9BURK|nr:prolyl oligopeptidase family serine peptidase [Inhella inkyongensis]MBB5205370.1 dienelactone hydrolase [Inhella inkyongensis]